MKEKNKAALIISHRDDVQEIGKAELLEQKYRVIQAKTKEEARLKYANEPFEFLLIDLDLPNFKALDFIESIRRKENYKSIQEVKPILLVGDSSDEYVADFSSEDMVKFLETPFDKPSIKKKTLEFGVNTSSEVINNNTKLIPKDEYLITEGGKSHEMFWVLSGSFVVTKMNQDDHNVIIGKVFSGELVGEMSFLDSLPRSASVKALEDSEVLVIPHKKFIDVMEGQPRWFRSLMQTLSQRLRGANKIIARKYASVSEDNFGEEDEEFKQLRVDI